MGRTVTASAAAAVAIILLNLCPPSYGKDVVAASSLHINNDERRSLRRGMVAATNEKKKNGIEGNGNTQQSVKFHTKLSAAATSSTMKKNKRVPLNNKFYDMSGLTEKERDELMEMAQSLKASEDSIDWDAHRDEYVQVLKQSMSRRSQPSSDEETATAIATSKGRALQTEEVDVVVVEEEDDNFDGDVFDQYEYSKGNCPNAGSQGVPCAPDNLPLLCNKYNREEGSFRACLDACKEAFCCVHNAPAENWLAPNCNTDENCSQYNWCYIAWWKLRDTIGPALLLRIEQNDDFFDIPNEEISEDVTGDPFYQPFFLSPFGDINKVIEDGTEEVVGEDGTPVMEFNAERIFLDPEYWDYEPEY